MEKKTLTFEEKMDKLSSLVEDMDSGTLDLDKMLEKYDEAISLINELNKTIEEAKEKVAKVDNK